MGQSLDRDAEGSSKPKVSDLQVSCFIDQKILGLQIPVDDSPGVAVVDSIDELVEEEFDLVWADGVFVL